MCVFFLMGNEDPCKTLICEVKVKRERISE